MPETLTRRGFLKCLATAAVATAVPITLDLALRERLPVIYGDGVHDDTEGLQAALDGKPFVSRDRFIKAEGPFLTLRGADCHVSRMIRART